MTKHAGKSAFWGDPARARKILFALFCLANATISFNFTALAAAVPVMSRDLGVPAVVVSQISAYYMIPYGVGALLYAPLLSRFSLPLILGAAMAVYGVLNGICAVTSSMTGILAVRILMGLTAASVIPLCLIAIGTLFPPQVRGRRVGLFFSMSFVASVAGIALSGLYPWRWLFWIPGGLGLLTAGVMFFASRGHHLPRTQRRVDYARVLRDPQIRRIFVYIFVVSLFYHGVHKWLAVYLEQLYHLEQMWISALFILIALSGAVGQNFGGYLTDMRGRLATCQWGVWLLAAATMLLLGVYPVAVLALILAVFAAGWTIGHNGISTVLTDFPDDQRTEIAALNSAVRFLSGGLGFFLGGPFMEGHIQQTFFGFGVILFIASFFVARVVPPAMHKKGEGYA